jgi:WD40-like Beta Propeller Repeat
MTVDPYTLRLVQVMDELAAGDDGYVDDILRLTATMKQHRSWTRMPWVHPMGRRWAVVIVLSAILTLMVASAAYVASRPDPTLTKGPVSNGWIGFSTVPGVHQIRPGDLQGGSDLYIVREGTDPILIAGREGGMTRNVCPAFSPDGSMLAYGTSRLRTGAVVIVTVADDGGISEKNRIPLARSSSQAPCPRWSADSRRLVYLDATTPIVSSVDGAAAEWTSADPPIDDLTASREDGRLRSPTGDRTAGLSQCLLNVKTTDGTTETIRLPFCPYALAAWSPDGKKVLVMEDVSGRHFTMHAVAVDAPYDIATLASRIPINGLDSWPGRGDVAWQSAFD